MIYLYAIILFISGFCVGLFFATRMTRRKLKDFITKAWPTTKVNSKFNIAVRATVIALLAEFGFRAQ